MRKTVAVTGTGVALLLGQLGAASAQAPDVAVGGDGTVAAMRNRNGATIQMTSTTQGRSLTLATEGVNIALAN